jgi:phosphatidylserine decarboxylase
MRLHNEGKSFITVSGVVFFLLLTTSLNFGDKWYLWALTVFFGVVFVFMLRFFRSPKRAFIPVDGAILAPCDGTVVIVEDAEEKEYFKDRRLQVSIFMSVNNVHINWVPLSGKVKYFRHHQGKYLVAWHPKSSEKNERTTFVVDTGKTEVLFRQIAGYVARRIVTYVKTGDNVVQNQELGFIKFGSRLDLFLPRGTEVCVKKGDKTTGTETVIARLK